MATITVVRSLVGQRIELPGDVFIRPWYFVELGELSDDMKAKLKELRASRMVQISQVVDNMPLPEVKL